MPNLPVGAEVPSATSSRASLSWATQQMRRCKAAHRSCNASSASPLPSRVLDVEATGTESGVSLREPLAGESAPYVCLSHCWGRRPFLRTLSGSLDAHRRGIAWETLPPTFRDAVDFTRKLGIRYLWIDSLCIVQDDQHDWRREAAKMASIYQNCVLVISAAKSPSAYDGLYAVFPSRCKSYPVRVGAETVYVRVSLTHIRGLHVPHASQPILLPTLTRGWIFQERFLSPRVLHFGPEEMSWECLEVSACQCTAHDPDASSAPDCFGGSARYTQMLDRAARPKTYYNRLRWQSMEESELQVVWHRMVEDYTKLRLTYERDIFPAISGLAKEFQAVKDMTYVAGLWRETLLQDLLWHIPTPSLDAEVRLKRPKAWRAPSWSWAAVDSPVDFFSAAEGLDTTLCKVLDVEVQPAGPDPTGELASGGSHLLLHGRLVPARLRRRTSNSGQTRPPYPWELMYLDILEKHLKNLWLDDEYSEDGFPAAESAQDQPVSCLLIGRNRKTGVPLFLVLSRALQVDCDKDSGSREHPHCYRRIGLVEVNGGLPGMLGSNWIPNLLEQGEDVTVKII